MNKDEIKFIEEGILRYKSATSTYVSFMKLVEKELQNILKDRKNWKNLEPNYKTIKSTRYGVEYPLLNSRIECNYKGQKIKLIIAINWYDSDKDTPYYSIWSDEDNFIKNSVEDANEEFFVGDKGLRFYPDFSDINLKRDFNFLIDEYLKYVD